MSDNPDTWEDEGEHAQGWKPSIGDSIEGTLVGLESIPDKYRPERKAMVLKIRDGRGKLWIWFPGTDARRKIADRWRAGLIDIGKPFAAKRGDDIETRNGILKTFSIKPAPTAEMAKARALEAIAAELPDKQDEPAERPRKIPAPRGAQPVQSRTEVHADGFEDDIPF